MNRKALTCKSWMLLIVLSLILWAAPSWAVTKLVMGTGLPGGNYYKFGQLLADAVNKYSQQTGLRIKPRPSDGSISNLRGLANGDFQLGLSQADTAYIAWNGKGPWKKSGKVKGLRTVYPLFTEAVTCIASADSGILIGADLRGKRVALGTEGSGTHVNAVQALATCWLKPRDLSQALLINPPEAMRLMTQGKLDAFFYTMAHPNPALRKFISQYGRARFVPFIPTKAMTANVPYYVKYFLWTSDYPGLRNSGSKVDTFGIKCFLVTTDRVPPEMIYEIARTFLSQLKPIQKSLPPLRETELPKRQASGDSKWAVSAPYHEGIKRLFKERGAM